MSNGCLYIFLDEGGNLDFASSGTKYFTLTSVCTKRPFTVCHELGKYKFDLIEYGFDFSYFHCTKDNRHVRQRVFGIIKENIAELRIDSLIVEKSKIAPALQASEEFYPRMLGHLIRHVAEQEREELDGMKELIVITDSIPIKKKRAAVEKAVKTVLKKMLPSGCRFRVLHHASMSNMGLQVADYCNWAIFRKWESGDRLFYDALREGIKSELEI
jgi:hypothetical protein